MNQQILARKIKIETNIRCDFDNRIIPKGTYGTQISGDEVPAHGLYHGRQCWEAACKHMEELKNQNHE